MVGFGTFLIDWIRDTGEDSLSDRGYSGGG